MRIITPFILAPALLLAACGDNDQQAQGNSEQRRSGQQVATTPNPPPTVPEQSAAAPIGQTPQSNPGARQASPETTATIPPTTGPTPEGGRAAASAPGIGAAPLQGRGFATPSGVIRFEADNRFTWRDQAGKTLTGRYVQEAERISFNEVQGDAGASIPMTCRYRMDGPNRFVVEDSGTTCPVFRGLTFEAQAG